VQTELCPYVLASVGCLTDANDATGYGVYASIEVRGKGMLCHWSHTMKQIQIRAAIDMAVEPWPKASRRWGCP